MKLLRKYILKKYCDDIEYDYWDEFCESGKIDNNNVEGYYEYVGEEDGRMYFYIVE